VAEERIYDVGYLINAADDLDEQLFHISVAIQIGTDAGRWSDLGGAYVIQLQPNTTTFVVETDGYVHEAIEQILTEIELAGVVAKND
jgi:hypothetical protein